MRCFMKNDMMIVCGFVVILMICVMPAGAHVAVDDAFTVINTPLGYGINILQNDIPYPDPSISYIELTENPKHGSIGGWGENIFYSSYYPYFGPDYFKYRTFDGHSYSNEATVYLDVVPYWYLKNLPSHVSLHIPADTTLSLDSPDFAGISPSIPREYLRLISEPIHGKLIGKRCTQEGFDSYDGCFNYIPDAGFTGWDSFIVRPYVDSGPYGDCPGKEIDVSIYVGPEPYPSPEFPSVLLPISTVIAFFGAVLIIQRSKDH